ncbi:MAG TPA: AraC family transcriptional regulator [Armatimonadota bacterium]|nr:AraC family transcriptional regulator [Armatimonadota bacterium]
MVFIWSGLGEAIYDGEPMQLRPGTVIFLHPGVAYQATHDPVQRLGHCFMHFDFIDDVGTVHYPQECYLPKRCVQVPDTEFTETLLKHIVKLHLDGSDLQRFEAAQYLKGFLLCMLECSQQDVVDDQETVNEHRSLISHVTRMIRENPGVNYSVDELAHEANYSVDYFGRIFKNITGVSPKEFCIHAKISRAKELLLETDLAIGRIATNLGYTDVFFFSRQFKERAGMTPSEWRHTHRHNVPL